MKKPNPEKKPPRYKYKNEKIIVVTGDFDPVTFDDIKFFRKLKSKYDLLVVAPHSDSYIKEKRGILNSNFEERYEILKEIKLIDEIFTYNDLPGTEQLLKLVLYSYTHSDISYTSNVDDLTEFSNENFNWVKIVSPI